MTSCAIPGSQADDRSAFPGRGEPASGIGASGGEASFLCEINVAVAEKMRTFLLRRMATALALPALRVAVRWRSRAGRGSSGSHNGQHHRLRMAPRRNRSSRLLHWQRLVGLVDACHEFRWHDVTFRITGGLAHPRNLHLRDVRIRVEAAGAVKLDSGDGKVGRERIALFRLGRGRSVSGYLQRQLVGSRGSVETGPRGVHSRNDCRERPRPRRHVPNQAGDKESDHRRGWSRHPARI